MSENKVMQRIFGSGRGDITGADGKLYNDYLNTFYSMLGSHSGGYEGFYLLGCDVV
jgi:hypothetical protein